MRKVKYIILFIKVFLYSIKKRKKKGVEFIFLSYHRNKNAATYLQMNYKKIETISDTLFETFIPNIHNINKDKYDSYMAKDIYNVFPKLDSNNINQFRQKIFHYIVFGHIRRYLKSVKYIIVNQRNQEFILLLSKYLEKKFPKVKIAIQFIDSVSLSETCDITEYLKLPNVDIYSFDNSDIVTYGLKPYDRYVDNKYLSNFAKKEKKVVDVSFIGEDKGRVKILKSLSSQFFIPNKITTDFYVLFNKEYETKLGVRKDTSFKYQKKPLSANGYYRRTCRSRAMLEIVIDEQQGSSLRIIEATFLKRKIITNDGSIKNNPLYSSQNMFIIGEDDPNQLKPFIRSPFFDLPNEVTKQFTYEGMLENLRNNYQKNHKVENDDRDNYRLNLHNKIIREYNDKYYRKSDNQKLPKKLPTVLAIYLPQFHPFPENDQAWGKGFTEWTNVTSARPHFIGHSQPVLPSDLGFYDLRIPGKIKEQVELAKSYGISGFDFYYYWFSGKKIMDMPIEIFLANKDIDFKFSITWANENWARHWNDEPDKVIVAQNYRKNDPLKFIKDIEKFLLDKRYIRVDDKPLLTVYKPTQFPDNTPTIKDYISTWRKYWKDQHNEELFISYVTHTGNIDKKIGFDGERNFLPLDYWHYDTEDTLVNIKVEQLLNTSFSGEVRDIRRIYKNYVNKHLANDNTRFKCLSTAWDNQARRKGIKGLTYINSNPKLYEDTLCEILKNEINKRGISNTVVYINAWNEWAEGAMLEPSQQLGHANLVATKNALIKAIQK